MRIYANTNEAIIDIARELQKCASSICGQTMQNKNIEDDPNYETKELQAFSFTILDSSDKHLMPNLTKAWADAEFQERIGYPYSVYRLQRILSNPGKAYLKRLDVWKEFLVHGRFDYTYSERIIWQIDAIIGELTMHPETRQAIIEIHSNEQDIEKLGKDRIPCSLNYHFMIRNGALDLIYMMRSSDFVTHMQNDIYLAMKLQDYIAKQLMLPNGKFIMFVSSLHIYRKDWLRLTKY